MKAWLLDDFVGLKGLRVADVPDPMPGDGDVVIDLEYTALNPADRYHAQGEYPGHPPLPHVLGRDGIGIISAIGKGVEQSQIGQRVLIIRGDCGVNRWGTFAERVAVPIESIALPPAGWTVQQAGCAALVYMTAYQALTQWDDLPPAVVLITGASGGVGVATIHLAKTLGHVVVALTRGTAKHDALRQLGADHVVDSTEADWPAKLKETLHLKRVDLAVENIGGPGFVQVIETLGPFGKVSVVGQLAGPVPKFNLASLFFRRLRIGGVAISTYKPPAARAAWLAAVDLLGRTGARPVIDSVFPFDRLLGAFDRLAEGPIGKVLLDIRNSGADGVPSRP
jgi:NADPH2:quinone reductase